MAKVFTAPFHVDEKHSGTVYMVKSGSSVWTSGDSFQQENQSRDNQMKLAFVTNFCPHYRVQTFELLARTFDVDYFFYSSSNEWYWQQNHGVRAGNFHHTYLP